MAVIAFRPVTDQGPPILDKLEQRTKVRPQVVAYHGTRRFYLNWDDVGVDVDIDTFDSVLDDINPHWRNHLENWRDN
jgi:hypothetical protein